MNIPKAIEILELNVSELGKKMPPDCRDAVNLGIQALKTIAAERTIYGFKRLVILPGETKE